MNISNLLSTPPPGSGQSGNSADVGNQRDYAIEPCANLEQTLRVNRENLRPGISRKAVWFTNRDLGSRKKLLDHPHKLVGPLYFGMVAAVFQDHQLGTWNGLLVHLARAQRYDGVVLTPYDQRR